MQHSVDSEIWSEHDSGRCYSLASTSVQSVDQRSLVSLTQLNDDNEDNDDNLRNYVSDVDHHSSYDVGYA